MIDVNSLLLDASKALLEKDYAHAINIANQILNIDYLNVDAYIVLIKAKTENYNFLEIEEISNLVQIISLITKGKNLDKDYLEFIKKRNDLIQSMNKKENIDIKKDIARLIEIKESYENKVYLQEEYLSDQKKMYQEAKFRNDQYFEDNKERFEFNARKFRDLLDNRRNEEELLQYFERVKVGDKLVLKRYLGYKQIVKIPDVIDIIGENAFEGNKYVKEIYVPNSVSEIKDNAFSDCPDLRKIYLPYSIIHLGSNLFSGCTSLREISLPDYIEEIPPHIFRNCRHLEAITLPINITRISAFAFESSALRKIVLPNKVEVIDRYAFANCSKLEEIVLPEAIKEIDQFAFANTPISKIDIGSNIKKIEGYAFLDCQNLESIDIHIKKPIFGLPEHFDKHFANKNPKGKIKIKVNWIKSKNY